MNETLSGAVQIRPLTPDEAPALVECFRRCYGESYVVAEFYDPSATASRVRNGALRSVVAVTASGEIVGHMALTVRHPRSQTVDAGNSIVDPRYRGRHIVARLGVAIRELCVAGGFLGFHHYPTTVHPIMQKLSVMAEGFETGIMLGYIPSGTEYREIESAPLTDRPAVTVVYNPLAPTPAREVWVPACYSEIIQSIYANGRLPRSTHLSLAPLGDRPTELDFEENPRRQLVRISVTAAGNDLGDRLAQVPTASAAEIAQIDLRMDDPSIAKSVEIARAAGFQFCAVLPEWLEGDCLRLQRSVTPSNTFSRPALANSQARQILDFIESDGARFSPL